MGNKNARAAFVLKHYRVQKKKGGEGEGNEVVKSQRLAILWSHSSDFFFSRGSLSGRSFFLQCQTPSFNGFNEKLMLKKLHIIILK